MKVYFGQATEHLAPSQARSGLNHLSLFACRRKAVEGEARAALAEAEAVTKAVAQAQQRLREVASRRRAAQSRERVAAEEAQRMERAQSQARIGPVRTCVYKGALSVVAAQGSPRSDACGCCGSLFAYRSSGARDAAILALRVSCSRPQSSWHVLPHIFLARCLTAAQCVNAHCAERVQDTAAVRVQLQQG